jgi:hypothetical protein
VNTPDYSRQIKRPITSDGRVGYDQFGQLQVGTRDGDSIVYRFIADLRDRTCAICLQGWKADGDSLSDQIMWRLIEEHVHLSCMVRHNGLVERERIYDALVRANMRFDGLKKIANGYWPPSDPYSVAPWYQTNLRDWPVRLTIGWRKRVIELRVAPQDGSPDLDARKWYRQFTAEDVTKNFREREVYIYAWGYEKLHEYLLKVYCVLSNGQPTQESRP